MGGLHFLYCSLITIVFQPAQCLYSIYRLDEENPSFAIHGINLNRLGTITIYGHNESDFLVDYSQRGCLNRPDYLTNDQSSKSASQMVNCFDPFPLSVNGIVPEKYECKEVMPYDQGFKELLYMCSFKVPNTYQLIVKSRDAAVSLEYAISFRVSKWVDESRHTMVIPTGDSVIEDPRDGDNVLLCANTIAIIVMNPLIYKSGGIWAPLLHLWPMINSNGAKGVCSLYLPDSNCSANSMYSVYVGSDPGLAKSSKYHMTDVLFREEKEFDLSSSVITIFAERNDCNFCISYTVSDIANIEIYSERRIQSSNNYLWVLEDPNDFPDCQSLYAMPGIFFGIASEIRTEFLAFEGIQMFITGSNNRKGTNRCTDPVTVYFKSFESSPETLSLDIDCLVIDWCPTAPKRKKFGFEILLNAKFPNVTNEDCRNIYELSKDEPQAIFHYYNVLFRTASLYELICVFQDCPPDTICPLLIDLAFICAREIMDFCRNPSVWAILEVNNEIPEMSNCTFWESPLNYTLFVQCKTIVYGHAYYRWAVSDMYSLYLMGAISVRALQWTQDDKAFYLMPGSNSFHWNPIFDVVFPVHEEETWISMALANPSNQLLRSFTSSHTDECDYRMIVGPPDRKDDHPERHLFTFRGDDRFIEQALESELYSFLIPPGCSPSIVLAQLEDPLSDNDYYSKQQEICDGVSIITSHGYLNPFEFNRRVYLYYLLRNITCPWFKLNVSLEIISIGNGQLTITAFDKDSEMRSFCDLSAIPPMNCSISGVSKVQIKWIPNDEEIMVMDGCFVRVHLSRSTNLFTSPTHPPIERIILIDSFGSITHHSLSLLLMFLFNQYIIIT